MTVTPRIWIPGGSGMLGRAMTARLEAQGLQVRTSGQALDIADFNAVLAFAQTHKPTHIINCAAYTKVDACETQIALAEAANAKGPGHLAQVAAVVGAKIAHVSTDYVFDGAASTPYTEDAPCAPLGVYGRTKRAGEVAFWAALGAAGQTNLGYVVRTSWLFGHHGPNFVKTMLRLMGERPSLGVVGDQFGRPTFCDDLAEGTLGLLGLEPARGPAKACGTYHFANSGALSWHGFAEGILAQARSLSMPLTCVGIQAIATADYPTPARRPAYSVLCTDKVAQALGYTPRSWETALAAYLAAQASQAASLQALSHLTVQPRPTL